MRLIKKVHNYTEVVMAMEVSKSGLGSFVYIFLVCRNKPHFLCQGIGDKISRFWESFPKTDRLNFNVD